MSLHNFNKLWIFLHQQDKWKEGIGFEPIPDCLNSLYRWNNNELEIEFNDHLSPKEMEKLLVFLPNFPLISLKLTGGKSFSDNSLTALGKILNKNELKFLIISAWAYFRDINQESYLAFAESMAANSSLTSFVLEGCEDILESDTPQAVALAKSIATHPSLVKVSLTGTPIGKMAASTLGENLSKNFVLKSLSLMKCKMRVKNFLEGFKGNVALEILTLDNNYMFEGDIVNVCEVIETSNLKKLSLKQMGIGYEIMIHAGEENRLGLKEAVRRNTNLVEFSLDSERGDNEDFEIDYFLFRNSLKQKKTPAVTCSATLFPPPSTTEVEKENEEMEAIFIKNENVQKTKKIVMDAATSKGVFIPISLNLSFFSKKRHFRFDENRIVNSTPICLSAQVASNSAEENPPNLLHQISLTARG